MITSWVQTSQDHPSFLLLLLFCLQFSNLWSYEFASWYCWLIMETVCWIWTISLSWDANKILLSIWSGSSRCCLLGQLISTTDPQRQKQIGVWQIREIGAYDITAQINRRLLVLMEDKKIWGSNSTFSTHLVYYLLNIVLR
jgi:hypothetical protein